MSTLRGVLLIDKPKGFTSHDVVARIRRLFKTKEVGHAGTLDPMAEGLLVVLLGEATKLSSYVTAEDKSYIAQMDFGYSTDTLDTEGEVNYRCEKLDLSQEQITQAATRLVGDLRLPVPIYSAVKLHGRKLYEYARSGQDVEIPVRTMRFYRSEVIEVSPESLRVKLDCEKGAYIRAWVGQLGEDLGAGATMTGLVRQSSGAFQLKDGIGLEALTEVAEQYGLRLLNRDDRQKTKVDEVLAGASRAPTDEETALAQFLSFVETQPFFVPIEKCISGRFFRLDSFEERLMKNGQIAHSLEKRLVPFVHEALKSQKDQVIRVFTVDRKAGDQLRALIGIRHDSPRPKILRVFN